MDEAQQVPYHGAVPQIRPRPRWPSDPCRVHQLYHGDEYVFISMCRVMTNGQSYILSGCVCGDYICCNGVGQIGTCSSTLNYLV